MFTGLVEQVGGLLERRRMAGGWSLRVEHDTWNPPLEPGESIAVQGACLTVTRCRHREFACDLLDETMERTNFSDKRNGARLNLERALRVGDRFGGHIVSGHIDGAGRIVDLRRAGRDRVLRVECGEDLALDLVCKGSVACDGVSLTVTAVQATFFEVNLIPYTWETTSLGDLDVGDTVNVETDIFRKYVRRVLSREPPLRNLGLDDLQRAGFC